MRTFTNRLLFRYIPTVALLLGAFFVFVNLANAQFGDSSSGNGGSDYGSGDGVSGSYGATSIACTQEAKICPDGSAVGRTGPNCEFAACPNSPKGTSRPEAPRYLSAQPNVGSAPLAVNFSTNYGDYSSYPPSYADGQDTMIDFGDGSKRLWISCAIEDAQTPRGGRPNCNFIDPTVTNDAGTKLHAYAKNGTYTVKVIQTGGRCAGTCPETELTRQTIIIGPVQNFSISDIQSVVVRGIDPIPAAIDDEYAEYAITMKDGRVFVIGANYFAGGLQLSQLAALGYTSTLEEFRALIKIKTAPPTGKNFSATPISGDAPLKVRFKTDYGDYSSYRPSATDGSDTMIDFGDGSPLLWVQCKEVQVALGSDTGSGTQCWFVTDQKPYAYTQEHTYGKPGKYKAIIVKRSSGFNPTGTVTTTELASLTITVGEEEDEPEESSWAIDFFSSVADAFQHMFTRAVGFFFPGFNKNIDSKGGFSDLPEINTTNRHRLGYLTTEDIEAIIIDKKGDGGTVCGDTNVAYRAYVIGSYGQMGIASCSKSGSLTDYLESIARNLLTYYNYEEVDPKELAKLPIYIGNAEDDLAYLLNDTPRPQDTNKLGLEVKVKNKDGATLIDWAKGNVTIGTTDQLFFRWSTTGFAQCLPFLADNGTYAFTRTDDPKMLSGNTETEAFNIYERAGLYYVECATANRADVSLGSIHVTIDDDLPVDVELTDDEVITVSVDQANPLKVTVTYTNEDSGSCGPNYVGDITWGDGQASNEEAASTQAKYSCNPSKSVSSTHTYAAPGIYTIAVKRLGILKHKSTMNIGNAVSGFSVSPASGAAPLGAKFTFNVKNAATLEFGDGEKRAFSCEISAAETDAGSTQAAGVLLAFGPAAIPVGVKDPKSASEPNPCLNNVVTHIYKKAGEYTAVLTMKNGDKRSVPVSVVDDALSARPKTGTAPLLVSFSYKHRGNATLTFGDSSPSVSSTCTTANASSTEVCEVTRSHTYETPGQYEARLVTGCTPSETSCTEVPKVVGTKITVTDNSGHVPTGVSDYNFGEGNADYESAGHPAGSGGGLGAFGGAIADFFGGLGDGVRDALGGIADALGFGAWGVFDSWDSKSQSSSGGKTNSANNSANNNANQSTDGVDDAETGTAEDSTADDSGYDVTGRFSVDYNGNVIDNYTGNVVNDTPANDVYGATANEEASRSLAGGVYDFDPSRFATLAELSAVASFTGVPNALGFGIQASLDAGLLGGNDNSEGNSDNSGDGESESASSDAAADSESSYGGDWGGWADGFDSFGAP